MSDVCLFFFRFRFPAGRFGLWLAQLAPQKSSQLARPMLSQLAPGRCLTKYLTCHDANMYSRISNNLIKVLYAALMGALSYKYQCDITMVVKFPYLSTYSNWPNVKFPYLSTFSNMENLTYHICQHI